MLASSGTCIKLWNLEDFSLNQEITTSSDNLGNLSWNKDGNYLASLDKNSSEVAIYAVSSKSAVCTSVLTIMKKPRAIQFANTVPRYLALAGGKDEVLVWDLKSKSKKKTFSVRGADISHLSFSSTDSHLCVGTTNGEAHILSNSNNLVTGPVKLFSENTSVTDLQFSLKSQFLVGVCGENGSIAFLDINTKRILKEIPNAHSAPVSGLCFSPINELLMVTVGSDKKFNSYNVSTKRAIMSHLSSSPLTSVCFVENGQYVALGTMLGEILIHDLRMLRNPIATLSAYRGRVSCVKLQPAAESTNSKVSQSRLRASDKNRNVTASLEKTARHSSKPMKEILQEVLQRPSCNTNVSPSHSVTLELLSPTIAICKEDEIETKADLSPKPSLVRSARNVPRFDDLCILSPIDKENQSPVTGQSYNLGNSFIEEEVQHRVIDDILSPVREPHKSNASTEINSEKANCRMSPQKQNKVYKQFIVDELLSPVMSDCENGSKQNPVKNVSLSEYDIQQSVLQEDLLVQKIQKDGSIKQQVLLPPSSKISVNDISAESLNAESSEMGVQQIVNSSQDQCEDSGPNSKRTDKIQTNPVTLQSSESQRREATVDLKFTDRQDKTFDITENLRGNNTNTEERVSSTAVPYAAVATLSAKDVSSSKINVELIQNCVTDALENYQFDVNKRFMHMHYLMTKHFLLLKKEMKDLIHENSINEDLLLENERLREEIKRLKATF